MCMVIGESGSMDSRTRSYHDVVGRRVIHLHTEEMAWSSNSFAVILTLVAVGVRSLKLGEYVASRGHRRAEPPGTIGPPPGMCEPIALKLIVIPYPGSNRG